MSGLKDGWTTGSTATAAALAALHYACHGHAPEKVVVSLPPGVAGERLILPVEGAGILPDGVAWGEARKYAGDDPDVTNGMLIRAELHTEPEDCGGEIAIDGGEGIGRVTLPGLPVAVGQAAINPAPRAQMTRALQEAAPELALRVIVSAPEGENRAKGTMNSRLGIVGGISILGTQGIVRPFSNAAWRASLEEFVALNQATGQRRVAFATGRRSEKLLAKCYPDLPLQALMVAGDFVADALSLAKDFEKIVWGCFFGKLVKLAQGHTNTHAHVNALDMAFLARMAAMPQLAALATAQEALEILLRKNPLVIKDLVAMAKEQATIFAGRDVTLHLFHTDGRGLARL